MPPVASSSLPSTFSLTKGPVVSKSNVYVSRTRSGSRVYRVSRLASSCLSPSWSSSSSSSLSSSSAAIASSLRAGDREANRKGVHHCRRLRPGWHEVRVLADEKNPANDGEERGGRRKDRPEGAARDGTARCVSHSAALSRPVFTEVNERTCAPTWIEYRGARFEKGSQVKRMR